MKRILMLLSIGGLVLIAGVVALTYVHAPHAFADAKSDVCQGVGVATGSNGCGTSSGVDSIIRTAISILAFIVGVAAVIMIIVGGFKFITSSGDSTKAASARNTIIYAIIGLVVAVLAQSIVAFVIGRVH